MSDWKKSGVNEIYDLVMNLQGIDQVLKSLKPEQREHVVAFFAGYSNELMQNLDQTKIVASKMSKEEREAIFSKLGKKSEEGQDG